MASRAPGGNTSFRRSACQDLTSIATARNKSPLLVQFLLATGLKERAFLCAFCVALPNALITFCFGAFASEGLYSDSPDDDTILQIEPSVWSAIVAGLSFLVVFRASQAYSRFWQAMTSVHLLQIEWVDACSALIAFSSTSPLPRKHVLHFRHLIIRLFSLYHAAALLMLVEPGIDDKAITQIRILDPTSFNRETSKAFQKTHYRLELVGQWLQTAITQGMRDKLVTAPPPIVARCFQEIANGNIRFQDALKVKNIPFPKTYQLVCDILLGFHWLTTPFLTSLWVSSPCAASLFSFCSIFAFWSLIFVAKSIENPFSTHQFIREATEMQDEINTKLMMLMQPIASQVPCLPELMDEELESAIIDSLPLGDYWNSDPTQEEEVEFRQISTSHLVGHVTRKSKVKFGTGMSARKTLGFSSEQQNRSGERHATFVRERSGQKLVPMQSLGDSGRSSIDDQQTIVFASRVQTPHPPSALSSTAIVEIPTDTPADLPFDAPASVPVGTLAEGTATNALSNRVFRARTEPALASGSRGVGEREGVDGRGGWDDAPTPTHPCDSEMSSRVALHLEFEGASISERSMGTML